MSFVTFGLWYGALVVVVAAALLGWRRHKAGTTARRSARVVPGRPRPERRAARIGARKLGKPTQPTGGAT
jgi:hypothetical protein